MQQAIFKFLDEIYLNLNQNFNRKAIYRFKKAFDTVNHNILLNKISSLNVANNVQSLFKSYLSERMQQTFVNNILSTKLNVTTGVPQGSILGPLLFIIYLNDLAHLISNSKVIFYADDTVLYHSSNQYSTSYNVLQNDLVLIDIWCRKNLLQINVDKTKAMYICSKYLNTTSKPL